MVSLGHNELSKLEPWSYIYIAVIHKTFQHITQGILRDFVNNVYGPFTNMD